MTEKYILHPKIESTLFPEKIEVIFAHDICVQTVTTCLLRNDLIVIGFGWAIENPKDDFDLQIGDQWAFKRAINTMLNNISRRTMKNFSHGFRKEVDKKMRQALHNARKNENGR